jgi:hypothetical protein
VSTVPVVADRVMKARRESVCSLCGDVVKPGMQIARCPGGLWVHCSCFIGHRHHIDVPATEGGAAPKEIPA